MENTKLPPSKYDWTPGWWKDPDWFRKEWDDGVSIWWKIGTLFLFTVLQVFFLYGPGGSGIPILPWSMRGRMAIPGWLIMPFLCAPALYGAVMLWRFREDKRLVGVMWTLMFLT